MSHRAMITVLVLLLASASFNLYLVTRGTPIESSTTLSVDSGLPNQAMDQQITSKLTLPSPPTQPMPASSKQPNSHDTCEARLNITRAELDKLHAQVDRYLPPNVRFESGHPDPVSEDRLRPELQRVLNGDGGTLHWTVECRSQACKVHLLIPVGGNHDWVQNLQTDSSLRRMSKGIAFHGGAPTNDPITGEAFEEEEVYLQVADENEDMLSGLEIAKKLAERFRASDAVRQCTHNFDVHGTFEALISINEAGFRYRIGGTLGATEVGRCIAARLEAMGRIVQIPKGTAGGVTSVVFHSPPEQATTN